MHERVQQIYTLHKQHAIRILQGTKFLLQSNMVQEVFVINMHITNYGLSKKH